MKTITSWRDLEAFGIIPLTLESCALSWRLLCDLNEQGARVVRKCFGLLPDSELGEAWNRGSREAPHTASIMVTQEMLIPLAVFSLLESGTCREVHLMGSVVIGIEAGDPPDAAETMRKIYRVEYSRRFSYGPHGGRNQHMMSGRID